MFDELLARGFSRKEARAAVRLLVMGDEAVAGGARPVRVESDVLLGMRELFAEHGMEVTPSELVKALTLWNQVLAGAVERGEGEEWKAA